MASDTDLAERMRRIAELNGKDWAAMTLDIRVLLDTGAAEIDRLRARVAKLERERSDLMRVLEAMLIEVEPLRYEQRQDIERACRDQAEWAKRANASRIPGSEPWAFMNEFRRRLESKLEPLSKAVQEGNAVYDRIAAGIDNTKGCSDA